MTLAKSPVCLQTLLAKCQALLYALQALIPLIAISLGGRSRSHPHCSDAEIKAASP